MSELSVPAASPSTTSSLSRSDCFVRLLLWFVLLSGAGLYLFARTRMNPAVSLIVGGHILLGVVLLFLLLRVLTVWKEGATSTTTTPLFQRWAGQGGPLLIVVASLSGGWLTTLALFGQSVGQARGAFLLHVVAGLLVLLLAIERLIRQAGKLRALSHSLLRRGVRMSAAGALFLISGGALAGYTSYTYNADTYFHNLTATDERQAESPFFPAGTRTASNKPFPTLPTAVSCGTTGCHEDIVKQWQTSGHAQAEKNSIYQTALRDARKTLGKDGTRWCAGCHNPGQVLMEKSVTNAVDCLSCHAMAHVTEPTGNGRAVYAMPPAYPFEGSPQPSEQWMHRFFLRVRPEPHRLGLRGPDAQTASGVSNLQATGHAGMCVPCHRLSVNVPQNHYKFLRYDDTWGEWQASSYSGESAHVFISAPRTRDCVDCHFRSVGQEQASMHACPGGAKLSLEERKKAFRVEFIALKEDGVRGRLQMPLNSSTVGLIPGETVLLDVLVETRGIGHAFPTGVPDLRQAWLEVTAEQEKQSVSSSSIPPPSSLRFSHSYGLFALDRNGHPVDKGNLYDMITPVYTRTLGADVGDVARCRLTVPKGMNGRVRLTARLQYRALPDSFAAQSGQTAPVTLAEQTLVLPVGGTKTPAVQPQTTDAQRLFAYGTALLMQEDRTRARAVLLEAVRLTPRQPDYLVALGRIYLSDGDLLSAQAQLRNALNLAPELPQARAWLGATYRKMGQFEAALKLLLPLSQQFPRDRLLWFDIGGCQLQSAQYEEAIRSFQQLLAIDPDDATAHFNLVQCYVALRRLADARKEEALFRALQDDPTTEIREHYLRSHPDVRREELKMHEHLLKLEGGRQ